MTNIDLVPVGDKKPVVSKNAYVDPRAVLIGEVVVEDGVGIWPGAVIRADEAEIVIEKGAMILENTVIEAAKGQAMALGSQAIISHGAIVHGAQIGASSTIGIGAIVLDEAVVEEQVIIGAAALVPAGKRISKRSLLLGVPGKIVRELTEGDLANHAKEWSILDQKVKAYVNQL